MSKIFYEETHNKLRKLHGGIKNIGKGEMELERVKGSLDKYEFVNHPFVRKYSSMRQFCEEMAKLVESQKSQFTVSSLEDDETRDVVYKSMTDVWGLLAHVFDYNLK